MRQEPTSKFKARSASNFSTRNGTEVILKEIFETKRTAKDNNNKEKNASMEVELINATSVDCFSAEDVEKCVKEGVSRRTVSATQCNAQSSRSHAVLRLAVHKTSMLVDDDGEDICPSSASERDSMLLRLGRTRWTPRMCSVGFKTFGVLSF